MSDAPRAVFLSYASQDTEAARRVCDALRTSGIEVWFDVEGGLETGDEWDAKIRRQIKECVLFIPLISANTQAREEGYFRIEWDLAAERARGIASGVAFILPIVIDDTREPDALVPDRFRSVQWTRARDGELSPAMQAKFAKLWSHRLGLARHKAGEPTGPAGDSHSRPPHPAQPPAAKRSASPVVLVGALVLLLSSGAAVWFFKSRASSHPAVESVSTAANPAGLAGDFPRDPELKRARSLLFTNDAIAEDFLLADDIVKPVLALRPNDPEVVTVAAEIAVEFLVRGFGLTPARRTQAQRLSERAVQLAPDNPYALAVLARYLVFIGAQQTRAEEMIRRAIALRPDEPRYHRTLFDLLARTRPAAEVDAYGERMAAQFPDDALIPYDIGRRYKDENDLAQAEKWFDRTLRHAQPPAFAFIWKAWFMLWVHRDPAAMKQWLERVPDRQRSNARVANARYLHALVSGDDAHAFRSLNELPDEWLTDFDFTGPRALLLGMLNQQAGRSDLAKVQFENALANINAELEKDPTDFRPYRAKMWTLIGLDRLEEARAIYQLQLQATRRPYRLAFFNLGWTNMITCGLVLGYRAETLVLLRETCIDANTRLVLRNMFKLDPRLAPWRDDAEINAILAEPAAAVATASAPASAAAPASEGAQLATRAIALTEKVGFTRDDLAAAEDLARRATEREPDSALAWGARAWVQAAWIMRGWDVGEARRQETQTFANRSLAFDPDQPDALYALSYVFSRQGALEQAEAILRKAIAGAPENPRIARTLGSILVRQGRIDDAARHLESVVARFPRDPVVRYEFALVHAHYGFRPFTSADMKAAEEQLDAALALSPFSSALILRAVIAAVWDDDYATVRERLTQLAALPLAERTEDRTVGMTMWLNLLTGQYDQVFAASSLTSRNHFEDAVLLYPHKHWLLALASERQGKPNLARTRWQEAEPLLRQRAAEAPGNTNRQFEHAITLARVGRGEEAQAIVAQIEPAWREELTRGRPVLLAMFYASLGDAPRTVEYLRPVIENSLYLTRHTLRRDPWWDPVRDSAEFQAMLAQLGPQR